jgi:hypothetical protein
VNKIPECDRCRYFSHQLYFICAVHPEGVEGDDCPDFQPEPNVIDSGVIDPEEL